MDWHLRKELCSKFQVIREILREISAISIQTREALEAQLEVPSAFQCVLDMVSSKLRGKVASLPNREVRGSANVFCLSLIHIALVTNLNMCVCL